MSAYTIYRIVFLLYSNYTKHDAIVMIIYVVSSIVTCTFHFGLHADLLRA